MLRNASEALAQRVAADLGMPVLPDAMPRALKSPFAPEVTESPALSLMFRPSQQGIRARKMALLAADGVAGASLMAIYAALGDTGAISKLIAPRIGLLKTAEGNSLMADASLETEPGFLFDAPVLPEGQADPGMVLSSSEKGVTAASAAKAFINAIGKHQHFERETDPHLV